jgi:hypothetical protein
MRKLIGVAGYLLVWLVVASLCAFFALELSAYLSPPNSEGAAIGNLLIGAGGLLAGAFLGWIPVILLMGYWKRRYKESQSIEVR